MNMNRRTRFVATVLAGLVVAALVTPVSAAEPAGDGNPSGDDHPFLYEFDVVRIHDLWHAELTMSAVPDDLRITLNGTAVHGLFDPHIAGTQTSALAPDDGLKFGENLLVMEVANHGVEYPAETVSFEVEQSAPLVSAGPDLNAPVFSTIELDGTATRPRTERITVRRSGTREHVWPITGSHWRIVRAPSGSSARLLNENSLRPSITPDVQGTYRLQLTVQDRSGRLATDTMTLDATPNYPAIGVAVETMALQGAGSYAIALGGNCTEAVLGCQNVPQLFPYGSDPVQLLILDRDTLENKFNQTFAGSDGDAAEIFSQIQSHPTDLAILAVLPDQGVNLSPEFFGLALSGLISPMTDIAFDWTKGGWSAIGVSLWRPQGQPAALGPSGYLGSGADSDDPLAPRQGNVKGYFQRTSFDIDNNSSTSFTGFNFVSGGYAEFNTSFAATLTQNTMRINGVDYVSSDLSSQGCAGGFQLVMLRADTLSAVGLIEPNQTFLTNCGQGGRSDRQQIQWMASTLEQAFSANTAVDGVSMDGALVFLQSIGTPLLQSDDTTLFSASQQLSSLVEQLGGIADAFNKSMESGTGSSAYALAGSTMLLADAPSNADMGVYAPEASGASFTGSTPPQSVFLEGLLQRNYRGHFTPVSGGVVSTSPGLLPTVTFQDPIPWPTGSTTGEQAALTWFSDWLGLNYAVKCYEPAYPDVRAAYCDLDPEWTGVDGWTGIAQHLENNPAPPIVCDPTPCAFTQADWDAVYSDLTKETRMVSDLQAGMTWYQTLYGDATTDTSISLQDTIGTILSDLSMVDSDSGVGGFWVSLASDILNVAGSVFPGGDAILDATKTAIGVAGNFGSLASQLMTGPNGDSFLGQIQATAEELPLEVSNRFAVASDLLGHSMNIILGDYGKLEAINESNIFEYGTSTRNDVITTLQANAKRFAYGRLLSAGFNAYGLLPDKTNPGYPGSPADYTCYGVTEELVPFTDAGPDSDGLSWIGLTRPNIVSSPLSVYGGNPNLLVLGHPQDGGEWHTSPPDDVMSALFEQLSAWPTWFFRHNFRTTGFSCENLN